MSIVSKIIKLFSIVIFGDKEADTTPIYPDIYQPYKEVPTRPARKRATTKKKSSSRGKRNSKNKVKGAA